MSNGIYKKIAAIQANVGNIPKNGRGPAQKGGFEFVRFDDVVERIHNMLNEYGVITEVKTLEHKHDVQYINNRMNVNVAILVAYRYIDTEDGSIFASTVAGEGSDIGADTATRKAYSQALKVNLLQTFTIVTGDEPDSDGLPPRDPGEEAAATPVAPKPAGDSVDSLRKQIGAFINDSSNSLTKERVNEIGDTVTKKDRDKWFSSVADLKKVLAEVEKEAKGG